MNLIRYAPSVPVFTHGSLLEELDRLFDAGLPSVNRNRRTFAAAFPVDVFQDSDAVFVRAELPGFRKEDLGVNVADDALTITGRITVATREGEQEPKTEASVERVLALPENLNYEKAGAAYENGVLTITLPKREEVKPKAVAIEVK